MHDFQGWIVRDLLKLNGDWDDSYQFRIYSELAGEFNNKGFPDFTDKITQQDYEGLNDLTKIMEKKLLKTPILSKVPNFSAITELRAYLVQ